MAVRVVLTVCSLAPYLVSVILIFLGGCCFGLIMVLAVLLPRGVAEAVIPIFLFVAGLVPVDTGLIPLLWLVGGIGFTMVGGRIGRVFWPCGFFFRTVLLVVKSIVSKRGTYSGVAFPTTLTARLRCRSEIG